MDVLETKKMLLKACEEYVENRASAAQLALDRSQSAANSETKSTAGDKHEVGRAMMQADRDKAAFQLQEALKLKKALVLVDPEKRTEKVESGSLVITNKANFYIAISAGKISLEKEMFIAMAATAPLAQAFLGKSQGALARFNQTEYLIKEVL